TRAAASRTFWTAGRSRPMRTAMMAITTNSSISVKAPRAFERRSLVMGRTPKDGWIKKPTPEGSEKAEVAVPNTLLQFNVVGLCPRAHLQPQLRGGRIAVFFVDLRQFGTPFGRKAFEHHERIWRPGRTGRTLIAGVTLGHRVGGRDGLLLVA